MAWAKTKIVKSVPNVGAQAIAKTPVGRKITIVICFKGGKYSSANKPLSKRVL